MSDNDDFKAAQAHRRRLARQAIFSAKDRDKVAASGAPQRDHVAATVLFIAFCWHLEGHRSSTALLKAAAALLSKDGYAHDPTWDRMLVMARQPRRKLKPPKPRTT